MSGVIDITELEVRAGRTRLLHVDRWSVKAGEMHVVLGPNGAGKSTLLRALTGFVRPASGRACVLGEDVTTLGFRAMGHLRRRVAYMPQVLPPGGEMPLTVREVVAIGRTGLVGLGRRLRREDWRVVDAWIDRLGLAPVAGRRYSDGSGGEQRKTLIAKAMVQQPELLLLDEPTANLDLRWREEVVDAIETVHADEGVTTVMVCHELDVVPPSCDGLLLLEDGRAVAAGTEREVLTDVNVARLFGARVHVVWSDGRAAALPVGRGGEDA
ncbi:MAG: ATP-binding cassette domain-containing protein [Planctomycetes bacterium]|nr:ATP-binding cassette domain-containing protein [Planctomycetota bacterium]